MMQKSFAHWLRMMKDAGNNIGIGGKCVIMVKKKIIEYVDNSMDRIGVM